MHAMKNLPSILKTLRGEPYGLSQTEISRRTGLSQSSVSRWEAGKVPENVDGAVRLLDLANQLGMSLCTSELSDGAA